MGKYHVEITGTGGEGNRVIVIEAEQVEQLQTDERGDTTFVFLQGSTPVAHIPAESIYLWFKVTDPTDVNWDAVLADM